MAIFEPTPEEKAAHSYLDWDDEALGKFTKEVALWISNNAKNADGLHKVSSASCAMMLISQANDSNAGLMTIKLDGHTSGKVETGDWIVTVRKVRNADGSAVEFEEE